MALFFNVLIRMGPTDNPHDSLTHFVIFKVFIGKWEGIVFQKRLVHVFNKSAGTFFLLFLTRIQLCLDLNHVYGVFSSFSDYLFSFFLFSDLLQLLFG